MRAGDRVQFNGRHGTVVGFMPGGMIDVRFDGVDHVERRSAEQLAKTNPARRNPKERVQSRFETGERGQISQSLGAKKAAFFTRPDPIRRSNDNVFCGNPIDGTAYYIAVDGTPRVLTRYITWDEMKPKLSAMGYQVGEQEVEVEGALQRLSPARGGYRTGAEGRNVRTKKIPVLVETIEDEDLDELLDSVLRENEDEWYPITARSRAIRLKPASAQGPESEMLVARGKGDQPKAAEATEEDFYTFDPATGRRTYYRAVARIEPGREYLQNTNPYAYRTFTALSEGDLLSVLTLSSRRSKTPVSQEVAELLIRCGAVSVERKMGERSKSVIEMNPTAMVYEGNTIKVRLKAKSNNPFFSWKRVTGPEAIVESKGDVEAVVPCLSKADDRRIALFQTAARILGAIQSNFQAIRGTLRNVLEDQPGREAGTDQQLQILLRKNINTIDWLGRFLRGLELDSEIDPTVLRAYEEIDQILRDQGFGPLMDIAQSLTTQTAAARKPRERRRRRKEKPQEMEKPKELATFKPGEIPKDVDGQLQQWLISRLDTTFRSAFSFMASVAGPEAAYGARSEVVLSPVRGILDFLAPQVGDDAEKNYNSTELHELRSFYRYLLGVSEKKELIDVLRTARPTVGRGTEQTVAEAGRFGGSISEAQRQERSKEFEEYSRRDRDFEEAYAALDVTVKLGSGMSAALQASRYSKLKAFPWKLSAPFSARRIDENRTVGILVRDFYLGNIWGKRVSNQESATRTLNLLLLSQFYYLFGGYSLLGPIEAGKEEKESVFRRAVKQLQQEKLSVFGESKKESLLVGGRYTVYKTYNPVLFEITRLYWQTLDSKENLVLRNRSMIEAIDTTGRYGYSLKTVQNAALVAAAEDEVTDVLRFAVHDVEGVSTTDVLRGLIPRPPGRRKRKLQEKAPPGTYETFLLLWPLGYTREEAQEWVDAWTEAPLAVLSSQKKAFQQYVQSIYKIRTEGTPKPEGQKRVAQTIRAYRSDLDEGTRKPIDPRQIAEEDRPIHQALQQSLRRYVRAADAEGKDESAIIRKFQSSPLNVRTRTERGVQISPLEMGQPTDVYEDSVVSRLLQMEDSLNPPPDSKYRMGPLFGEESKPEMAILPRSVWSHMAETKKLHQERIAAIDSALKTINNQMGKSR